MKSLSNKSDALKVAKLSSLLSTILLALAGTTSALAILIPSHIFGFLLVPVFIVMVVSIYYFSNQGKYFGIVGIAFAILYSAFISFNYFLQLAFHGRGLEIPSMLDILNPDSLFMVIELLGYFFMGLSTIFLVPLFPQGRIYKGIKILFLLNGALGIGGILGYVLHWNFTILLVGLIVWNVIMPVSTFLVYLHFRRIKS